MVFLARTFEFFREPWWGELRGLHAEFVRDNNAIAELVAENPEQSALTRDMAEAEAEFFRAVSAYQARAVVVPEDDWDLAQLRQMASERQERLAPLSSRVLAYAGQFDEVEREILAERHEAVKDLTRRSIASCSLLAVLAVVISLASAGFIARSITKPLHRLREATAKLLGGNFRVVMPSGPAEIAELITRFNQTGLALIERKSLLEEQEERYRTYVGSSSAIMWTANSLGKVVDDIPAWTGFTGQTPAQVRGSGWLSAVHPDDLPAMEHSWTESVKNVTVFDHECRLRSKSGEYRHFACRAVPIFSPEGSAREWVGTCSDVTSRREQELLRHQKEAAEAANQAKSEFLTRMSHELRTPLNAVIGMSKMLTTQRFGVLNVKQADYIADICRSGEHLLALVNDILDLAKVESGKMELHPEAFSARKAIEEGIEPLRTLADAKRIDLTLDPPEFDDFLLADPVRLKQVINNLVSNAIKFTPEGGSVIVRWSWVDGLTSDARPAPPGKTRGFRLEVGDNGIGISPEDQQRIWAEFTQLKSGQALTQHSGTGSGWP